MNERFGIDTNPNKMIVNVSMKPDFSNSVDRIAVGFFLEFIICIHNLDPYKYPLILHVDDLVFTPWPYWRTKTYLNRICPEARTCMINCNHVHEHEFQEICKTEVCILNPKRKSQCVPPELIGKINPNDYNIPCLL